MSSELRWITKFFNKGEAASVKGEAAPVAPAAAPPHQDSRQGLADGEPAPERDAPPPEQH